MFLHSDPWTWFFFPLSPCELLPPAPVLLEISQYKVTLELHTSGWALNSAFATQPKLTAANEMVQWEAKASSIFVRRVTIKLFLSYTFSKYKLGESLHQHNQLKDNGLLTGKQRDKELCSHDNRMVRGDVLPLFCHFLLSGLLPLTTSVSPKWEPLMRK